MKYFAFSMVSALALASLGTGSVARPLPQTQSTTQQQPNAQSYPSSQQQSSQTGSAGGYAGTATEMQNNDYSQVAPGNNVMNGGSQSAQLLGQAGSVLQNSNLGSFLQRRQSDAQQASAAGYAGESTSYQDNDYSAVAPGNSVQLGGSQSTSDQGTSGTTSQSSNIHLKRSEDPTGLLSLVGQGGQLPTGELPTSLLSVRAVEGSNSNGVYLASTQFGPVESSQEGSYGVPRYMGLGPEVRPTPL